jgi:DNA-binding MarR family transcriptional regulator
MTRAARTAHELRLAVGSLVRAVNARGAVPAGQLAALGVLDRDGAATTSDLAARTRVRPQSMAATVQSLVARGLVEGRPHPTDGRKTLLAITDAGRDVLGGERDRREDRLAAAIDEALTPDERATLEAATPLLARLADHAREG